MCLHKEYFTLLFLTQSVELQHLNKALTCLLNDCNFKMVREKLHANIEIAENVIDVTSNFLFICFDNFVEAAQ